MVVKDEKEISRDRGRHSTRRETMWQRGKETTKEMGR